MRGSPAIPGHQEEGKTRDKLGDTGEDKPKLSEASDSKETSKAINA